MIKKRKTFHYFQYYLYNILSKIIHIQQRMINKNSLIFREMEVGVEQLASSQAEQIDLVFLDISRKS